MIPQNDANLLKFMQRDNGAYDNLTKIHTLLSRVDYQPNTNNSLNFRFELSHPPVQTKYWRIADANVNIAGPLLHAGLQQFVDENRHAVFLLTAVFL